MKKLMMMAAVAMIAGLVQAAAVQWNSGTVTDPVMGLNIGNTSGAYLATVYFFSDAGGTTPVSAGTGAQISDTSSTFGTFSGTSADVFTVSPAPSGYYARMVIESSDGLWIRTSDIGQINEISSLGNATVNFGTGAGFVGGTAGGTLFTTGWTPVPEPTSFALLAIGAAALGLRRRLRK